MNRNGNFFLGAIVGAAVTFVVLLFAWRGNVYPFQRKMSIKEFVGLQKEYVDEFTEQMGLDKEMEELKEVYKEKMEERQAKEATEKEERFTAFDKPKQLDGYACVKVRHVLDKGKAQGHQQDNLIGGDKMFNGKKVLLYIEGRDFYDDEEVSAPKGKAFYVIGTYRNDYSQTLPVVSVM